MALTNIEYGSLASSETMNNNFTYLDDKIDSTSESILTSISSLSSNIATINSRLNELSSGLSSSIDNLDTKISGYRVKTKLLVKKAGMVPDWSSMASITLNSTTPYTAADNGYLLIMPLSDEENLEISIGSKTLQAVYGSNLTDDRSVLIPIPIFNGNVVSVNKNLKAVYFVPAKDVEVENF